MLRFYQDPGLANKSRQRDDETQRLENSNAKQYQGTKHVKPRVEAKQNQTPVDE
jgi:hypothetical protein